MTMFMMMNLMSACGNHTVGFSLLSSCIWSSSSLPVSMSTTSTPIDTPMHLQYLTVDNDGVRDDDQLTSVINNVRVFNNDSSSVAFDMEAVSTAPELPFYIRVNVTCFCVTILVVGLIGNLLVPLVVWRNRDMRNSTNFFLVNLSVADLLVLVVCMPTVLVEIHSKPEVWNMGEVLCKVVPFLELAVTHGSVLTILAISFERYYAICKPLKAGYKLTRGRALVTIVSLWFFSAFITSPVMALAKYEYVEYIDDTIVPVCTTRVFESWEKIYFLTITVVFFLLPLLVLIVIYSIIVRHLGHRPAIMNGGCVRSGSTGHSGSVGQLSNCALQDTSANMRARRQVVVMVGTVVLFFFVCLLPFRVLVLRIMLGPDVAQSMSMEGYYTLVYFSRIMFYINSAINPILYNLTSTKFRQAFMRALGLRKARDKRHRLDRQTTFNTTYSSLYSSLKARTVDRTLNGHVIRQNSATATVIANQDSAV